MSFILNDYECKGCDTRFESNLSICPRCGTSEHVEKIFLKAPGLIGTRTKQTDALLEGAASEFGGDLKKQPKGGMLWGQKAASGLGMGIDVQAAMGMHENALGKAKAWAPGLNDFKPSVVINDPQNLKVK